MKLTLVVPNFRPWSIRANIRGCVVREHFSLLERELILYGAGIALLGRLNVRWKPSK